MPVQNSLFVHIDRGVSNEIGRAINLSPAVLADNERPVAHVDGSTSPEQMSQQLLQSHEMFSSDLSETLRRYGPKAVSVLTNKGESDIQLLVKTDR